MLSCCSVLAQTEKAVGELLAIIGQNSADTDRTRTFQVTQKAPGIGGCLVAIDGNEDWRTALSITTKRYPHDVSLAIRGRYLTSMWMYPGSYALKPLCLGFSSLALRSRRLPTPCLRRQRSKPERDTFGFKNSRSKANRSSNDTSNALRSSTATAYCTGVRVV